MFLGMYIYTCVRVLCVCLYYFRVFISRYDRDIDIDIMMKVFSKMDK